MSASTAAIVETAREILNEHNNRHLRELQILEPEKVEDVVSFLTKLRMGASFWALASDTQAEEFWDMVRGDEAIMRFVMSGTSELRLRLVAQWADNNSQTNEWTKLCRGLANAYGDWGEMSNNRSRVGSLIDPDTLERLPSAGFLQDILLDNPWLVTLFLLETLPYLQPRQ